MSGVELSSWVPSRVHDPRAAYRRSRRRVRPHGHRHTAQHDNTHQRCPDAWLPVSLEQARTEAEGLREQLIEATRGRAAAESELDVTRRRLKEAEAENVTTISFTPLHSPRWRRPHASPTRPTRP